jgi:uncharacterized cupin superfamily protein
MPKLDLEQSRRTTPPATRRRSATTCRNAGNAGLGPLTGLTHIGATHVVLRPGAWSSQRHWHYGEDELLVMLTGERC